MSHLNNDEQLEESNYIVTLMKEEKELEDRLKVVKVLRKKETMTILSKVAEDSFTEIELDFWNSDAFGFLSSDPLSCKELLKIEEETNFLFRELNFFDNKCIYKFVKYEV